MRNAAGGVLIAVTLCLTLLSDVTAGVLPRWVAGVSGWCAVGMLIVNVKVSQRWQAALLTLIGIALLLPEGESAQWGVAIGNNAGLVGMLAAVGFLRLIALTGDTTDHAPLPTGFKAYVKTLLGVSLFGSVINISAPILFADRLYEQGALQRLASQSITRVFTATAAWSPLFGSMAAVLTYIPDTRLSFVVLAGLPFTLIGFVVVVLEARLRYLKATDNFQGYPVNFYNLWIPAALAAIILLLTKVAPQWSVLTWISLACLLLTTLVLVRRVGVVSAARVLCRHVIEGLPTMINELQLFLAAGVLAAGISSLVSDANVPLLTGFGAAEASLLLGAMIVLAIVGVHPVVVVSGATPLLMTLEPAANLLAMVYLLAWALGTCASPLSGTHLVFQGRYGIASMHGAFWNLPYVAIMYGVSVVLLWLAAPWA